MVIQTACDKGMTLTFTVFIYWMQDSLLKFLFDKGNARFALDDIPFLSVSGGRVPIRRCINFWNSQVRHIHVVMLRPASSRRLAMLCDLTLQPCMTY